MDLDPVMLARLQFAFSVSFHILFPAFTIGLAAWLVVLEGVWLRTGSWVHGSLSRFWTKIFAVSFGMGVVSGIVMSFQFGTNWGRLSDSAGNILGPLLNYEVLTAFFLEATFLGVLLFGRDRVPRWLHFMSACAVAVGTLISAFWILSANSWMHTPAGSELRDGTFYVTSWWEVVFNPSFPYRFAHMVVACFLTTSFVVAGVSAWHLLKQRSVPHARIGLSMALGLITLLAPAQLVLGDLHGLNTLEHQPVKIMAMEGHFESHPDGAPLILFGIPDQAAGKMHYAIEIPKLSSLILKHDLDAPLAGLDTVPDDQEPPVAIVFWSFRIMIALGFVMLGVGLWSLWSRYQGRLFDDRWLHRAALAASPAGLIAVIAGWITTEVGRQPYTVYGELLTADSVSPLAAPAVGTSLLAFVVIYFLVFGSGVFYILRLMSRQPHPGESTTPKEPGPIRTAGITPAPQLIGDSSLQPGG
jgi:cytochrome d ubiquinol oxidase subunit I